MRKGQIRVETENIFPIIRKWLYEDQDIFLREIVSNAADAIAKYRRLVQLGEIEGDGDEPFRIDVIYDRDAHTVTVKDNGIGMTADEIERYINQIAFSGAVDFVEKYKDQGDAGQGIIGHFGLGFYSAFMVSEQVTIDSLSWQDGAEPAKWTSDDGTSFVLEKGSRETRGTTITMTLNEEARETLDGPKIREILRHYCLFMPVPIFFTDIEADKRAAEQRQKRHDEAVKEAESKGEEAPEAPETPEPQPINETEPLWLKSPSDIDDEEYKAFYRETFRDYREPLFWIHLNMDYPIRLNGILYFPQKEEHYETFDGRIKLFYNQVFVADDIKEIIPDFLLLLKGCIDSPDLPLNVSRSALQNEPEIRRLGAYIVRKVADKLTEMCRNDREAYDAAWDDLALFVRYGALRDPKFLKRVKPALMFRTVDDRYLTLDELPDEVYYTTDPGRQVTYIRRAKDSDRTVIVMDDELDLPFLSMLEHDEDVTTTFRRIDAHLEGEDAEADEDETKALQTLFNGVAAPRTLKLSWRALGEDEEAAVLIEDEEARNMLDMQAQFARMQGKDEMDLEAMFPVERTLVLNTDAPLVKQLRGMDTEEETARELARELYDLARLSHGSLEGEDLLAFLKRTTRMLNPDA